MQFAFETDDAANKFFEIVVWALETYFGHSEAEAMSLVNDYYLHNADWRDVSAYHHEGVYPTAARAHYFEFLKGDEAGFYSWKLREGHWHPPREVYEYFREHYFENDAPLIAELWKRKPDN
jgi:hypothetical protein